MVTRTPVPRTVAVLLVATTPLLAGCGGDDDEGASPSSSAASTTTAAETTTSLPPTTTPPPTARVVLEGDGLGLVDLGDPADVAIPALTDALGPPDDEVVLSAEPGAPFLPYGWSARNEFRMVTWGPLTVVFSDAGYYRSDGSLHAIFWAHAPGEPSLRTESGVTIGTTVAQLGRAEPQVSFGMQGPCAEWEPEAFELPGGIAGSTDWDWTRALQTALNRHGATLAVDGTLGPRTRAALTAFQHANGIPAEDPFADPMTKTFAALGIEPDSDARVVRLWAGNTASC